MVRFSRLFRGPYSIVSTPILKASSTQLRCGARSAEQRNHSCFSTRGEVRVDPRFRRFVLGCIDGEFYNGGFILQHFSRSSRRTCVCTVANSTCAVVRIISRVVVEFSDYVFANFQISLKLFSITKIVDVIFTHVFRNCGKFHIIAGSQCIL